MAKFAVLFVGVLALHTVLAHHDTIKDIKYKISTTRNNVMTSLDSVKLSDAQEIRAFASQVNDFTYKLENVIHRLFQLIIRVNKDKVHGVLPEVAMKLNDIVHDVQEVIITRPRNLPVVLKESVEAVFTDMEKVIEVIQYFEDKSDENQIGHDARDILEKLFDAVRRLEMQHEEFHRQPLYKIHENKQEIFDETIRAIDMINSYDEGTAHRVTHEGYDVVQFLRHIVHHFEREAYHFQGDTKRVVDHAFDKINEARKALDEVVRVHNYRDLRNRIDLLKKYLKAAIQEYSTQIMRLLEIVKTDKEQVATGHQHLIREIANDCINKTMHLKHRFEDIAQHHLRY